MFRALCELLNSQCNKAGPEVKDKPQVWQGPQIHTEPGMLSDMAQIY